MTAIDHGVFILYKPDHEALPKDHPFKGQSVLWLKNERDEDWYDLQWSMLEGSWCILCNVETGRVESQSNDPSTLFPCERRMIESDTDVPDRTFWDGSKLVTPPEAPPIGIPLEGELDFKVEENNIYSAWHKGVRVAQVHVGPDLKTGKPCSQWMQTDVAYQRRGVISALVKFIELIIGEPLTISSTRTLQGAQWRDKFDAQKPPLPPDPPA